MHEVTEAEAAIIETTRRLTRKLMAQVTTRGVTPADATIGLAYALHDAATELTGDPISAVEWMRTAADLMDRQMMGGGNGRPN
ncbi:hypothetical protein [Croceicoccus marinus]|uniref:Uncharacterized protein n=1 Tax=Croceicoccus marinus TaxID=450378 RepID=A0A7G6VUK1_9SPHN|nr:hypothetical protein [Croceicoccus marinus]QNE05416.1 hypothetical protein H4O24_01520 [Croceicoccus marinus]